MKKIKYAIEHEPLVISKATMDVLLKDEKPSEVISLYLFYYYTAKWQKTNMIKATTQYCANGLNVGVDKIREIKKRLFNLNLIEDIVQRSDDGKVIGHYIQIHFVIFEKNHPLEKPDYGFNHPLANEEGNALINSNINALRNNKKIKNSLKRTKKPVPKFYSNYSFFKDSFQSIWFDEFLPLKVRKKASLTERALTDQLNKIQKFSKGDFEIALEILKKSVNSGWSDFYELKDNKQPTNKLGSRHYQNKPDTGKYPKGIEV